jgi:hypothetical protein
MEGHPRHRQRFHAQTLFQPFHVEEIATGWNNYLASFACPPLQVGAMRLSRAFTKVIGSIALMGLLITDARSQSGVAAEPPTASIVLSGQEWPAGVSEVRATVTGAKPIRFLTKCELGLLRGTESIAVGDERLRVINFIVRIPVDRAELHARPRGLSDRGMPRDWPSEAVDQLLGAPHGSFVVVEPGELDKADPRSLQVVGLLATFFVEHEEAIRLEHQRGIESATDSARSIVWVAPQLPVVNAIKRYSRLWSLHGWHNPRAWDDQGPTEVWP